MNSPSVYCISEEDSDQLQRSTAQSTIGLAFSLVILAVLIGVVFFTPLPPDRLRSPILPGLIGGFAVLPGFILYHLVRLLRTPRRVELDGQGLDIFQVRGQKRLDYRFIEKVELLDDSATSSQRHLMLSLKDVRGRELAQIKDNFDDFEALTGELRGRVDMARGRSVTADLDFDDREARIRQRAKRSRNLLLSSLFVLIMGLVATSSLIYEYRLDKELRTAGTPVEAVVTRHYVHKGITHRLEYEYRAEDGRTYSRNIMLPESIWEMYPEGGPLPVLYLPDDYEVSLFPLEEEEQLGLVLVGGFIMILFGGLCFFMGLTGSDLEYIDGEFYWLKRGELVEDRLGQ